MPACAQPLPITGSRLHAVDGSWRLAALRPGQTFEAVARLLARDLGATAMARKLSERARPSGLMRWALRAPISLYRYGLGWVLGGRFLLLEHVGAKTGLPRRTVLEVVKHDPAQDVYYLAVGFGDKSHWFRNLRKTPEAAIQVGRRKLDVRARVLEAEEGGELMADYAQRHPAAARNLMKFCGFEVDGSDEDYREVARLGLHFVALHPR